MATPYNAKKPESGASGRRAQGRFSAVFLAVRANPVEVEAVDRGFEPVAAGQRVLQGFDLRVHDFDVASAALADKMIVVGVPGVLVPGEPVPKTDFPGQSRFAQQLHGAINRGLPERRIFAMDEIIDFFRCQVSVLAKKNFHNPLALRRVAQPLCFEE